MNKVIKYLLSIISKIFSFSIFSFIFLLLFLQFGTLNLQFLDPIIKSNFADKYLTKIDFVNNDINLKFNKNNNDFVFAVNSRLKNKLNVTEWSLLLDTEIRIKVLLSNLEKNVVAFKLSSSEQKKIIELVILIFMAV